MNHRLPLLPSSLSLRGYSLSNNANSNSGGNVCLQSFLEHDILSYLNTEGVEGLNLLLLSVQ